MPPQIERTPSTAARCNTTSLRWQAAASTIATTPLIIQDIVFQSQRTMSVDLQPKLQREGGGFEYTLVRVTWMCTLVVSKVTKLLNEKDGLRDMIRN